MGVSIWEGGKAERAAAALEAIAETFDVIDDTSGAGDTDVTWSADKLTTELAGKASLDSGGKVPSSQLPSYVDDVLEYANTAALPQTGESGKIYVALDTGKTYRWTGSTYAEISQGAVTDVQVNGTSVLSSGIANIPKATRTELGVAKVGSSGTYGLDVLSDGTIITYPASVANAKSGVTQYRPITPSVQDASAFYGLAKAAGDSTQASSNNAVGTYTDGAKEAIRSMIGAENGDDIVKVQDTQPATPATKIWFPETAPASVQVPTVEEMNAAIPDIQINGTSIVNNGVASIPIAQNNGDLGLVKITNGSYGIMRANDGYLCISSANDSHIKAGTNASRPIVPSNQEKATFYGLAKAAGNSDQSSSDNAVGTYTDAAKRAIREMLGLPRYVDWELIYDYTATENLTQINVTTDLNGLAFELRKLIAIFTASASTTGNRDSFWLALYGINNENTSATISLPSLTYPTATSVICARVDLEANPGMPIFNKIVASTSEGSSQNVLSMPKPQLVKKMTGFKIYQSGSDKSLIPSGANLKIYGIRA